MDNIPILGQPLVIHDLQVITIISCKCQPSNSPITILGTQTVAQCPTCGKGFVLAEVNFDRSKGPGISGRVGVVVGTQPTSN